MKIILTLFIFFSTCDVYSALPANLQRQLLFSASDPVTVRHAGDNSGRLFIAEQVGTIKIWDGTSLLATNFIDISSKVASGNERGLLGLDFDPNYATNGFFYVYYTKNGTNFGDTIIERYSVSADANIADATSGQIILRVPQPFSNHNGGDIHFGPDGYLYIGLGDGGSGGDPGNRAQNLSTLLGKMLRIDVSSTEPVYSDSFENLSNLCGLDSVAGSYKIPNDNPFINQAGQCAEIWSYGLRNPYRWSFDKLSGDLIIGDVGQNLYEEVDFQSNTSTGGENYGWRCREGAHDFDTSACTGNEIFTEPVIDLPQSSNNGCSVMGGYVYRGSAIPAIQGLYVFSDYCGGEINFATPTGATWSFEMLEDVNFGTRGFGEDEAGEIYHIFNNGIYKFILN
jgi:glucose/arabinose dehydrogenase